MNGTTKEIAARFSVSMEKALEIQNYIENEIGIDWSEATQKKINRAYDEAAKALKVIA